MKCHKLRSREDREKQSANITVPHYHFTSVANEIVVQVRQQDIDGPAAPRQPKHRRPSGCTDASAVPPLVAREEGRSSRPGLHRFDQAITRKPHFSSSATPRRKRRGYCPPTGNDGAQTTNVPHVLTAQGKTRSSAAAPIGLTTASAETEQRHAGFASLRSARRAGLRRVRALTSAAYRIPCIR